MGYGKKLSWCFFLLILKSRAYSIDNYVPKTIVGNKR